MLPWSAPLAGRIDEHVLDSRVLRGNPLGDPATRPLWVYVPPGYDADPAKRYPTVYVLQGLTGQLDMWRNRAPFRPTYAELVDAMFVRGDAPPGLIVPAGPVLAWTSAVAAYGALLIPDVFRPQVAAGTPQLALYGFAAFYVVCLVVNWWYYARRRAEIRC